MKDKVSIERLKLLHPKAQPIFQKFIEDCEAGTGLIFRIVQGLRTFTEQLAIYNQGRIPPTGKIVTKSKPGQSFHNYGLAIDMAPLKTNNIDWNFDFKKIQQYMPENMIWGADWDHDGKTKADGDKDEHFVDSDHYELPFGFTWQKLIIKYNANDFIPETKYLNI